MLQEWERGFFCSFKLILKKMRQRILPLLKKTCYVWSDKVFLICLLLLFHSWFSTESPLVLGNYSVSGKPWQLTSCAGQYARQTHSYLRIIYLNKIWTKILRQRRKLLGECKYICSRENYLESEYVEMLGQETLM